jgi:protein gp37
MNKTKIEWTDYTINPIKGKCKMNCDYCYALRLYDRFKWNPEIRFAFEEFDKLKKLKSPSKIFLCSTHELFGNWITNEQIEAILKFVHLYPQHIFQILTKNPVRMMGFVFPKNVWTGVTITNQEDVDSGKVVYLKQTYSTIKFISFEPLHSEIHCDLDGIDWIIVGAETGNRKGKIVPNPSWIENLIIQAGRYDIPVFIKNNIKWGKKIQEFPNTIKKKV